MRLLSLLSFLLITGTAFAQDTLYRNKFERLTDTLHTDGYTVVQMDDPEHPDFVYESWYQNGSLHSIHHIRLTPYWERESMSQYLFPDGSVYKRIWFKEGRKNGNQEIFHPNGQLKRRDTFKNDTLVNSDCYHNNGEEARCLTFYTKAHYVYGKDSLSKILWSKISYPDLGKELKMEGLVVIFVYVNPDSSTEFAVARTLHKTFDQTVIEALSDLQFIPATEDGKPVGSFFPIGVKFRLQDDLPLITIHHYQ